MIRPSETGRITENLYAIGPARMPLYLLDGASPALFDAGLSVLGEHYLAEIRKFLGNRSPAFLFISHVHFDHCGAAGFLKRSFPEMTICASPVSAEIIAKPSALALIDRLNTVPGMTGEQRFISFSIDRTLQDGDRVRLGDGLTVHALATPGHTRDMTSYYLPDIGTLLPSEAAGVPEGNGNIFSEFLVDYDDYFASINRLAGLAFDRILCAHRFIYDGDDARGYFADSIEQTVRFREWIAELLAQHSGDHATVAKLVKAEEYENSTVPKMPEPAYDLNLAAKIRAVARLQTSAG